jgi:hypothetical protein
MRQELINAYVALQIAKVKEYVYGDAWSDMMCQIEETMTPEEYMEAKNKASLHFGNEPMYKQ